MAVWCMHGISYGFHCIPHSEGCNDVFSAIYTRWPKAPEVIIYGFACALGPYCLVREAQYFAKTICGVDGFHWPGHKKCGQACAFSTYGAVDPQMRKINTSTGKCGNRVLTLDLLTKRVALLTKNITDQKSSHMQGCREAVSMSSACSGVT
jgi:hypothetical protein